MAPAPATIPISTAPSAKAATTTAVSSSSTNTAAVTTDLSSSSSSSSSIHRIAETVKSVFSNSRPWGDLIGTGNADSFSRPHSMAEATTRARSNFAYFHGNYAAVTAAGILLSFLSQPWTLLVVLAVGVAWGLLFFWRREPLVLFDRQFSDQSVLTGLLLLTALAVFFSNAFWNVFSGAAIGLFFCVLHALFRNTDDVFIDEEAAANGGIVANAYSPIPTRRG